MHAGALGWNAFITFGALYFLVPRLWNRERLYSTPELLALERQIIYRARSPGLYDLVCDSAGVVIQTDGQPITLSTEQVRALRQQPNERSRPVVRWLAGGVLVLAGAALLWFLRPRRDD